MKFRTLPIVAILFIAAAMVVQFNNHSMMFVTTFIGRLHLPTGQLTYCNAGHLPPVPNRRMTSLL